MAVSFDSWVAWETGNKPKKNCKIWNQNAKSKNFKNYANPIYYPPPPATIATTSGTMKLIVTDRDSMSLLVTSVE